MKYDDNSWIYNINEVCLKHEYRQQDHCIAEKVCIFTFKLMEYDQCIKDEQKRFTYVIAHANNETWNFNLKILGNRTNFDIIRNDFKSSTN